MKLTTFAKTRRTRPIQIFAISKKRKKFVPFFGGNRLRDVTKGKQRKCYELRQREYMFWAGRKKTKFRCMNKHSRNNWQWTKNYFSYRKKLRSQWNKRELYECAVGFHSTDFNRCCHCSVLFFFSVTILFVACLSRCDGNDNNNDGCLL